jgi:predicted HAD superfamily Cof-like phosphohydrolase
MTKTKTNFKKVCDFNTCFGLPHFDNPQHNILKENTSLSKLRIDLCTEEIEELNEAFTQHDLVEVIDALTDELYVLYGAGSSFGIDLDHEFRNRLQNIYFLKNVPKDKTNFELLQMYMELEQKVDYIPPTINKGLFKNEIPEKILTLKTAVTNKVKELEIYKNECDFPMVTRMLVYLLFDIYKLGIYIGIDLDRSFDIVHKSNMSKLCVSEEESQKTIENYKQTQSKYDSPNYKRSNNGNYWIVYNESTGKILKSINYTAANFESMLF